MTSLRTAFVLVTAPLLSLAVYACGSSADRQFTPSEDAGGVPEGGMFSPDAPKPPEAKLSGKVFAPNGTLPIAGALVYVTKTEPEAIPEGAFCDKCVSLTEGTFAYSQADGSFSFSVNVSGEHYIVVQKGQFRRVRKVDLVDGENKLDAEITTLPPRTDAAKGDTIPHMLVLKGDYDDIEDSLQKLGIAELTIATDSGGRQHRTPLKDLAELSKYQVIFIPCSDATEPEMSDPQVKDNLAQWVASGGKLYVTDWSYEYARQPFGGYISWVNEGSPTTIGAAAGGLYDAPATAVDQGLADWLKAVGHPTFDVEKNYTEILAVNTLPGKDEEGNDVDITPKIWVEGAKGGKQVPTTVSFQQQCGRVLFSTYHTESAGAGAPLMAQEKALLHVLLEVGVCVGQLPGSGTK